MIISKHEEKAPEKNSAPIHDRNAAEREWGEHTSKHDKATHDKPTANIMLNGDK